MKSDRINKFTAISLLVTSMMGTGITFMPYAFNSIGYSFSWGILLWVSFCTFISLICISYVVKNSPHKNVSYISLSENVSKYVFYFVNISIFFNCFFSNVSFYRFLTDILTESLQITNMSHEKVRKIITIFISPILLYLSLKKSLVNFKFQSWISTCSVLFLSLLIIFYSITYKSKIYNSNIHPFNYNFKYAIPFFLPSMICENSMVEIVQKLNNNSWKNIIFISLMTSICGLLFYGLVGFCGYIVFGSNLEGHFVKEFYTRNSKINLFMRNKSFDKFNILSKLAVYSMVFVLGSGFPLQMVAVSNMFMQFIFKKNINDKKKSIVTVCLFVICLLLVLVEKLKIKLIKRVSGAIFSTSVGLINPFIYFLFLSNKKGLFLFIPKFLLLTTCLLVGYILITIIIDIINNDPELYN